MLEVQWVLPYELIFYIILSLAFLFGKIDNEKVLLYSVLLSITCYFIFIKLSIFNKVGGFTCIMLMGVSIYFNQSKLEITSRIKFLCQLAFLGMVGSLLYNNLTYEKIFIMTPALRDYEFNLFSESNSLLIGVLIAFSITKINLKFNKFFNFIADISYPLYLLHFTVGKNGFAGWFEIESFVPSYNIYFDRFLFLVFITIPLSYLIHISVERPFIEKSKILYRGLFIKNKMANR
jgi:peptidoglycan/LPS O-acetylase OafA/YrhL